MGHKQILLPVSLVIGALALAGCGSSSGSSAKGPSEQWTGLGAPKANWESAHPKETSGCSAGTCYGPAINSEGTPEFRVVTTTPEGRIDGYEQSFPHGTSAAAAKKAVQRLLPSDTRTTSFTVPHTSTGSCGLWNVQSATLGRWFANPKVGDGRGVMGIDLFSEGTNGESAYSASNVTTAIMSLAPSSSGTNC
jgi:hypothetical protein